MSACDIAAISAEQYEAWFGEHRGTLLGRGAFHEPAWLRAVAHAAGYRLGFIGRFARGELVAAVPGFRVRRGPFRLFGSPLGGTLTSYLGPVALGNSGPDALSETLLACSDFAHQRWGVSYSEFRTRHALVASPMVDSTEWTERRWPSYALDLTRGEAAIWTALRPRCRRQIRKSERCGIEIVPYEGTGEEYRRMLVETLGRRGAAVPHWYSVRFFRTLLDELRPSGSLWTLAARYEGRIIAVGLLVHDEREVHYISGASLSSHRHLPTSYLLEWRAVLTAMRAGLQVYDFTGTGVREIRSYKESFAPERIEYARLSRASRVVRGAKAAYLSTVTCRAQVVAWGRRAMTATGLVSP